MRFSILIILSFIFSYSLNAQHLFEGYIDREQWQSDVYLSVIELFPENNSFVKKLKPIN